MQLYDDITTVAAPPAAPAAGPDGPGFFTDGTPGVQGATIIRGWWLNLLQQELVGVVTGAGLTPSRSNSGQLLQAIQLLSAVAAASHTVAGKVQLATAAEVLAGTDDTMAATSLGVAGAIQAAVTALLGGAPLALSTLNELATALNDDATLASDIYTALGLKAPLAAPTLALDGSGNFPTTPTAPLGDATTKIANMAALAAAMAAAKPSGNISSPTGPWWSWDPKTGKVECWGVLAQAISAEGAITVTFPVTMGTFQWADADVTNTSGSNVGSATAQFESGTTTTATFFVNDSQTSGNAFGTGLSWQARGYSATLPVAP
jgi:hypothetical protein